MHIFFFVFVSVQTANTRFPLNECNPNAVKHVNKFTSDVCTWGFSPHSTRNNNVLLSQCVRVKPA